MIMYRTVNVHTLVCVGGHLAALSKPTEYNIKSPETRREADCDQVGKEE